MVSYKRLAWAFPVAALAMFGCSRNARTVTPTAGMSVAKSTTTTTTVAQIPAAQQPTAIGGGPTTDVHTDGPQRLDPARTDRLVEARKEGLRNDCYSPDLGAVSFVIDTEIAPDGRVQSAKVASANGDAGVAECVRGRIEKMTFPQTVEGGVHTFTILFGH